MLSPSYSISPKDLWNAVATPCAPHGLLERGFMVYDGLFAWLRFAAKERHNWPAKAA